MTYLLPFQLCAHVLIMTENHLHYLLVLPTNPYSIQDKAVKNNFHHIDKHVIVHQIHLWTASLTNLTLPAIPLCQHKIEICRYIITKLAIAHLIATSNQNSWHTLILISVRIHLTNSFIGRLIMITTYHPKTPRVTKQLPLSSTLATTLLSPPNANHPNRNGQNDYYCLPCRFYQWC